MINPPLIPEWVIATVWILAGVLCLYNIVLIVKYNHLTLSFLSRGLLAGLLILAPAAVLFGAMYYYYAVVVVDISVRVIWIRYNILYLAFSISVWQFVIIWLRGNNG